ncbi:YdcF family protein [Coralloluteibacterium thermophilus]|uniref:YdcF family protein n=1 Tax=Coralloluteibacterium thermophilum TaxID=2707049 RepID=A0ABV9NGV7_9GAMM
MSRRRRARARRWGGPFGVLVRLVLLGVAWVLGVAAYIVYVGERDDDAPRDAAIVLGAAAYHVRPSPVFEERIRHGVDLYRSGRVRALVFTGGYGNGAAYAESQVAQRYAHAQGVPDEDILIETVSTTTRGNLDEAARLLRENGLRTAVVVSDPLHMARALRLAREAGIDATGSPTPTTRFRSWRVRGEFLAREVYFFHRDHAEALWARLRHATA